MNVVLLSPHFPESHFRYGYYLKQLGVQVIGLADQPKSGLNSHVLGALTDYYPIYDMHDYNALLRTCGQITADYGKIDRIESLNEYWLETEAALRSDFNVFGYQRQDMDAIKKKSAMKAVFQAQGIPCAPGKVVHSEAEARQFAQENGFPIVLKPNIGVGANDTFKAESMADITSIFQSKPDIPYIIEVYISGQIISYDGLVNREGQTVFASSTLYSDGVMEVVNSNNHVYYYTLRQIPEDVRDLGEKMLQAFDVKERFFHFEFFRRFEDQELIALEVNMRPPGGLTVDMFNYANDIDLYKQWAYIVAQNQFLAVPSKAYFCAYIGRKFWKNYRRSHQEILQAWHPIMVNHGQLQPLFRKAMGDYFYLLRSPQEADILAAAQDIQALDE